MVLICNQPEEAEKVLEQLRFTPSKASRQRLKQMRPRGKASHWSKLQAQVRVSAGEGAAEKRARLTRSVWSSKQKRHGSDAVAFFFDSLLTLKRHGSSFIRCNLL